MQDKENPELFSLECAFKWFEYHAKQRVDMFKCYLLVVAGILSASGFSFQLHNKTVFSISGAVLVVASYIFWKIDLRTIDLIKIGEKTVSHYWNKAGFDAEWCPVGLAQVGRAGQMRYRHAFCVSFALTGTLGAFMFLCGLNNKILW